MTVVISRQIVTCAFAVVVLAATLLFPASAGAGFSVVEHPLCTAAGNQKVPDISGHWVVWQDWRSPVTAPDIYAYDLRTGEERIVCDDPAGQWVPAVTCDWPNNPSAGQWVVWADDRNAATSGSDIYAFNLVTGEERPLCTAPGDQWAPAAYVEWAVWCDERDYASSGQDIYAFNLVSGKERAVCTAPWDQSAPAIHMNWVVWEDDRNAGTSQQDIYQYQLPEGPERPICTAAGDQASPSVFFLSVAWADLRNPSTGWDIYMREADWYKETLGPERPVCTTPGSQWTPDLYGDWVAWVDGQQVSQEQTEYNIQALDLGSGKQLGVCAAAGAQQSPRLYGRWAVWEDARDTVVSGSDSYGAELFDPLPVYRFYNFRNGTHFYTASEAEKASVIAKLSATYRYEGVAYSVNDANSENCWPLYRFYNAKRGTHFYTASAAERDHVISSLSAAYRYEGVAYRVSSAFLYRAPEGARPVYRFYNFRNGTHFYTASEAEKTNVVAALSAIYRYEGMGYYLVD